MQVQKITFTPTFKTQQIKKYNQNISILIILKLRLGQFIMSNRKN